jgi:hypothetical protein
MWSMNGMIHTCTYHVDYKKIFCRFLTCNRRLSYSQHDKYRYVSCHSSITCQEPTEDCLIVNMISTGMYHAIHGSHVSGTDRRLSYSQHDKYMYVSYHSWITCQEPTEDCLIVNMISTGMYHSIHGTRRLSSVGSWHVIHEWHDTYLYLSCWL